MMKINLKRCGKQLELLFGTDAEFFLMDKSGTIIPASQVVPGLKVSPFVLENGVCHPDGLSLEVGCPPSDTAEGMLANLFAVINEVKVKYLDPAKVQIANCMQVDSTKAKNPTKEDLEFGCGSELDINSSSMIKQSDRSLSQVARYSGFHIHFGYTEGQTESHFSFLDAARLVKVLDALLVKHSLDTTAGRARQYGGKGAFRIKPYGIEYRAMDCSVITNAAKFQRLLAFLAEVPTAMENAL